MTYGGVMRIIEDPCNSRCLEESRERTVEFGTQGQRGPPAIKQATKRRLVVFHLAVETRNKNLMEIGFFVNARPNFWPKIENRLWVVLALNKTTRGP